MRRNGSIPTVDSRDLQLFFVGNASISKAHGFVDRNLSAQAIEDVRPTSVLHNVDFLRTFSDQCSSQREVNQIKHYFFGKEKARKLREILYRTELSRHVLCHSELLWDIVW